jgi:hypothetical protein
VFEHTDRTNLAKAAKHLQFVEFVPQSAEIEAQQTLLLRLFAYAAAIAIAAAAAADTTEVVVAEEERKKRKNK